jgi:FAD/FMN-containing dehydrogenase
MKATSAHNITVEFFQKSLDRYSEFLEHVGPDGASTMIFLNDFPFKRVNLLPVDVTAYNRDQCYNLQILPEWADRVEFDDYAEKWAGDLLNDFIVAEENDPAVPVDKRIVGRSAYWNESDGTTDAAIVFGTNYPRLREIKKKYDPDNVFHKWYPIKPAE